MRSSSKSITKTSHLTSEHSSATDKESNKSSVDSRQRPQRVVIFTAHLQDRPGLKKPKPLRFQYEPVHIFGDPAGDSRRSSNVSFAMSIAGASTVFNAANLRLMASRTDEERNKARFGFFMTEENNRRCYDREEEKEREFLGKMEVVFLDEVASRSYKNDNVLRLFDLLAHNGAELNARSRVLIAEGLNREAIYSQWRLTLIQSQETEARTAIRLDQLERRLMLQMELQEFLPRRQMIWQFGMSQLAQFEAFEGEVRLTFAKVQGTEFSLLLEEEKATRAVALAVTHRRVEEQRGHPSPMKMDALRRPSTSTSAALSEAGVSSFLDTVTVSPVTPTPTHGAKPQATISKFSEVSMQTDDDWLEALVQLRVEQHLSPPTLTQTAPTPAKRSPQPQPQVNERGSNRWEVAEDAPLTDGGNAGAGSPRGIPNMASPIYPKQVTEPEDAFGSPKMAEAYGSGSPRGRHRVHLASADVSYAGSDVASPIRPQAPVEFFRGPDRSGTGRGNEESPASDGGAPPGISPAQSSIATSRERGGGPPHQEHVLFSQSGSTATLITTGSMRDPGPHSVGSSRAASRHIMEEAMSVGNPLRFLVSDCGTPLMEESTSKLHLRHQNHHQAQGPLPPKPPANQQDGSSFLRSAQLHTESTSVSPEVSQDRHPWRGTLGVEGDMSGVELVDGGSGRKDDGAPTHDSGRTTSSDSATPMQRGHSSAARKIVAAPGSGRKYVPPPSDPDQEEYLFGLYNTILHQMSNRPSVGPQALPFLLSQLRQPMLSDAVLSANPETIAKNGKKKRSDKAPRKLPEGASDRGSPISSSPSTRQTEVQSARNPGQTTSTKRGSSRPHRPTSPQSGGGPRPQKTPQRRLFDMPHLALEL